MTKFCIYGAGAIGGYLGAELALNGYDVTLIARGPHLEAMKKTGLTLLIEGQEKVANVNCTDDPAEAGPQDFKLHAQPLSHLLGFQHHISDDRACPLISRDLFERT